jgi:hypothetical protein
MLGLRELHPISIKYSNIYQISRQDLNLYTKFRFSNINPNIEVISTSKSMIFLNLLGLVMCFVVLLLIASPLPNAKAQMDIPLEDVGNESANDTANGTESSDGLEQFTVKAQLKPDENNFLADEGYYEIKKFGFVTSNGSEICPSNNCKYGVEEGQFRSSYDGGYVFEGKLKVTTQEGDVKKSKFYDFNVDLDKTGEEEVGGEITQALEGTFGLGGDTFNPEITYDITNATLLVDEKSPVLTIQGERSPF